MAPTVSSIGTAGSTARRLVEIDIVGAEPPQRVGQEVLHRRGPAIEPDELALGRAQRAELHGDEHILPPPPPQRLADQHLIVPAAVEIAGVEEGHAPIDGAVNGGDTLAVVGRTIEVRHSHAAEAEGGNGWALGPEGALVHAIVPLGCVSEKSDV